MSMMGTAVGQQEDVTVISNSKDMVDAVDRLLKQLEAAKDKQTNFDRITESPEALAEFINDVAKRCYTCGDGYTTQPAYCPFHRCLRGSDFGITEWLNQEGE